MGSVTFGWVGWCTHRGAVRGGVVVLLQLPQRRLRLAAYSLRAHRTRPPTTQSRSPETEPGRWLYFAFWCYRMNVPAMLMLPVMNVPAIPRAFEWIYVGAGWDGCMTRPPAYLRGRDLLVCNCNDMAFCLLLFVVGGEGLPTKRPVRPGRLTRPRPACSGSSWGRQSGKRGIHTCSTLSVLSVCALNALVRSATASLSVAKSDWRKTPKFERGKLVTKG
eukprot:7876196-Pyramimonas_sp.AAC.1